MQNVNKNDNEGSIPWTNTHLTALHTKAVVSLLALRLYVQWKTLSYYHTIFLLSGFKTDLEPNIHLLKSISCGGHLVVDP